MLITILTQITIHEALGHQVISLLKDIGQIKCMRLSRLVELTILRQKDDAGKTWKVSFSSSVKKGACGLAKTGWAFLGERHIYLNVKERMCGLGGLILK